MALNRAVSPRPRGGFPSALASPAFRLIWLAQVAAQLGDKFLMFSLVILAYRVSHGSTRVAITLLAYTLPAVLIAPLAGVFADRHDRKFLMWTTSLARAALVALVPISAASPALSDDYWHLLVITFTFSATGQLFSPAEAAAIPTVLDRRALLAANSLVMGTMVLTLVAGGALAPAVTGLNLYAPYWLASGLFAVAGGLILAARIPRHRPGPQPRRHPFRRLASELGEGLAQLRRSPILLASFLQLSVAVLIIFMMFTLAPAFVSQVGIQAQDSYVLLVPAMVGALVGAVLLGQFGRGADRRGLVSLGLFAAGITLLGLAELARLSAQPSVRPHVQELTGGLSLLLGLAFGILIIPAATHLMERTEDQVRGRVFSLLYMVVNGLTALPVLVAAALADTIGTAAVMSWLAALLLAASAVTRISWGRAFGSEPG